MRTGRDGAMTEVTRDPEKQAASAQRLDPGLAALSLIAGYYRIAADPAQLRHQLALTGRLAGAEDLVRAANLLGMKSRIIRGVDAKRLGAIPLSGDRRAEGRRLRGSRDRRRQGQGSPGRSPRALGEGGSARRGRGACVGIGGPRHPPARRSGDRPQHLRLPLVLAVDPALPAAARRMCSSPRCSCSCSRWRPRSSSSSWSTRSWSTRACRPWWCSSSAW